LRVERVELKTTWRDHFRPPECATRIAKISFTDAKMAVDLTDGRTVFLPLSWFPVLEKASREARERYRLVGGGRGVVWDELDEDLSLEGVLQIFDGRAD
jgi:hypothetical protein